MVEHVSDVAICEKAHDEGSCPHRQPSTFKVETFTPSRYIDSGFVPLQIYGLPGYDSGLKGKFEHWLFHTLLSGILGALSSCRTSHVIYDQPIWSGIESIMWRMMINVNGCHLMDDSDILQSFTYRRNIGLA